MIEVHDEILEEAIESMAVMLDRIRWLDESRAALQARVWRRRIEAVPGNGLMILADVEEAVTFLVEHEDPRKVLLSRICTEAAKFATGRRARALKLAEWSTCDLLLYPERNLFGDRCKRGDPSALDQFASARDADLEAIRDSGLDQRIVSTVIDALNATFDKTVANAPAAVEARDDRLIDWSDADTVMAMMFREGRELG